MATASQLSRTERFMPCYFFFCFGFFFSFRIPVPLAIALTPLLELGAHFAS